MYGYHCCHENATMLSLCIVFVVDVAVNDTKVFSFAVEIHGFPLHFCRATKYFEFL